jgi:8-oxo-dGTP diphosphatase
MGNIMDVKLVNMIMIHNKETDEVVVQQRLKRWPGWAFPGGGLEAGESLYACAVREAFEETGLSIKNLELCGMVHWCESGTDTRYICFMYKTSDFSGTLTPQNDEGRYFWMKVDELLKYPVEKFSHEVYFDAWKHFYFVDKKQYSEIFIYHEGQNNDTKILERKYE